MKDITILAIQLGVMIAAFVCGKYIFPNIPKSVTDKFNTISQWAAAFVVWAKDFMQTSTGEEKMAAVVAKLKEIADEAGIDITEDQLKAIAQAAYKAMKDGEAAVAEAVPSALAAPTIVINAPAATVSTEGVAVATDNVPDGALEENPDGTVNVYDETGKKAGTMPKEAAEAAASAVAAVVVEE